MRPELINFLSILRTDLAERKKEQDRIFELYHTVVDINHWWPEVVATWTSIDDEYGWGSARDCWNYINERNGLLIIDWDSSTLIQNDETLYEHIEKESQQRLYSDRQAELEEHTDNIANDETLTSYDM